MTRFSTSAMPTATARGAACLAAFAFALIATTSVSAEYFEPAPDGGYLPERAEAQPYLAPAPPPMVSFGVAFDFGAALAGVGDIDDNFFGANDADTFGSYPNLAWALGGYVEPLRNFRIGAEIGGLGGGNASASSAVFHGGLLLEGGGRSAAGLGLWGGITLGGGRVALESNDDETGIYEFTTNGGLYGRVQIRLEYAFASYIALRLTGFGEGIASLGDNYLVDLDEDAEPPFFPDESGIAYKSAGIMFGIVIGSF